MARRVRREIKEPPLAGSLKSFRKNSLLPTRSSTDTLSNPLPVYFLLINDRTDRDSQDDLFETGIRKIKK